MVQAAGICAGYGEGEEIVKRLIAYIAILLSMAGAAVLLATGFHYLAVAAGIVSGFIMGYWFDK